MKTLTIPLDSAQGPSQSTDGDHGFAQSEFALATSPRCREILETLNALFDETLCDEGSLCAEAAKAR